MTASAEDATVDNPAMAGRSSAKGATGHLTYYIRCTRKTGR